MAKQKDEYGNDATGLGVTTARGGISYVSASLLRSLFVFLVLIILVRLLHPEYYGFYTIAISFYGVIEIIGYFGIGTALRKRLPEAKSMQEKHHIITGAYIITGIMGVALAIVAFLVSSYIASAAYHNTALTLLLEIASITVIADTLYNVGVSTLLGLAKNAYAAVSNVSYAAVSLVMSPALVLLGYGVAGALWGNLIGFAAAMFLSFYYIVKSIGFTFKMPSTGTLRYLMGFSLPVFISNLANTGATNIGTLYLGIFSSAAIVGNYGAAFKLGSYVSVILSATTFVLLPAFSHALSKEKLSKRIGDIFNGSLYYSSLLLFPLAAYAISVASPLTRLLFSSAYSTSSLYFAVISGGLVFSFIGMYAGTLMIGHGSVKRYMVYQLIIAVVQLAVMVAIVPSLKAVGTLIAFFVLDPLLTNVLFTSFLVKKFHFRISFGPMLRVLSASVIVGVLLIAATIFLHQSRISVLTNAVILLLLYPPLLALCKGIDAKSLAFIRRVVHRMLFVEPILQKLCSYTQLFIR